MLNTHVSSENRAASEGGGGGGGVFMYEVIDLVVSLHVFVIWPASI